MHGLCLVIGMASENYSKQVEEEVEVEEQEERGAEEADRIQRADPSPEEVAKMRQWKREQQQLKWRLIEEDGDEVRSWEEDTVQFARLRVVAGVDISFVKENPDQACAMLAVLNYPQLKVLHQSQAMVDMKEPYIPGFLAFREVSFLLDRLKDVQQKHPHLAPQVILVDGNGILHPRGFGLASHLGVMSEIPCVGVGKKLYHVDGLQKDADHKHKIQTLLRKKGDHFFLTGLSGKVWGAALRTSDQASNPVYVSLGHKISLATAVQLVITCSIKRVPEPVRQADLLSREYLRAETRKD